MDLSLSNTPAASSSPAAATTATLPSPALPTAASQRLVSPMMCMADMHSVPMNQSTVSNGQETPPECSPTSSNQDGMYKVFKREVL